MRQDIPQAAVPLACQTPGSQTPRRRTVVVLVGATVAVVEPDRQRVRRAAVGTGLGLVNLSVGYLRMRRALRRGMKSAMATFFIYVGVELLLVERSMDRLPGPDVSSDVVVIGKVRDPR